MLTDAQIADAKRIYHGWQDANRAKYHDVPELCKSATFDEIKAKDYSLAPSKYIEFIDHDLEIDYKKEMARIQSEMRDIMAEERKSQAMLTDAFRGIGYEIV